MFDVSVAMLSDVTIGVGVDMLFDMDIIVMVPPVITLELVVGVAYAGNTVNDVDMLTDENENGLATATSALEFTLPAP